MTVNDGSRRGTALPLYDLSERYFGHDLPFGKVKPIVFPCLFDISLFYTQFSILKDHWRHTRSKALPCKVCVNAQVLFAARSSSYQKESILGAMGPKGILRSAARKPRMDFFFALTEYPGTHTNQCLG
jgi:hypothetical protein